MTANPKPYGLHHAVIALAIQAAIAMVCGNWWIGAAAGATFYISRELTQAEYRWIDMFSGGDRDGTPWWAQFDPRVWLLKSYLDAFVPLAAVVAQALIMEIVQ